jgi:hypothetical protein
MTNEQRIDKAIDKLKEFTLNHPENMVILENVKVDVNSKEIALMLGLDDPNDLDNYFRVYNGPTFLSRWHQKSESSKGYYATETLSEYSEDYSYFLKKYGSLSWLIPQNGIGDVYGYNIYNVSGAPSFLIALPLSEDSQLVQEDMMDYEEDVEDFEFDEEMLWEGRSFTEWLETEVDDNIDRLSKVL